MLKLKTGLDAIERDKKHALDANNQLTNDIKKFEDRDASWA